MVIQKSNVATAVKGEYVGHVQKWVGGRLRKLKKENDSEIYQIEKIRLCRKTTR